jgi:hypothetical protein
MMGMELMLFENAMSFPVKTKNTTRMELRLEQILKVRQKWNQVSSGG